MSKKKKKFHLNFQQVCAIILLIVVIITYIAALFN